MGRNVETSKEGVKSLFGGWLDDVSGGDGDGRFIKYLDNITTDTVQTVHHPAIRSIGRTLVLICHIFMKSPNTNGW